MIDEILAGLFGEIAFGRLNNSRRAQLIGRLLFGLIGGFLAAVGCYHFALEPSLNSNVALRGSIIALFLFLGCFSLFNIALARKWRWPGKLFILSLIAIFVTRILFGP